MSRYFSNRFPPGEFSIPTKDKLASLKAALDYCLSKVSSSRPSVYTGTAGQAYMLWHVARHGEAVASVVAPHELLCTAASLARTARAAVEHRPLDEAGWSLLAGHGGVWATGALCFHAAAATEEDAGRRQRLQAELDDCLSHYRDLASLAVSSARQEDEFLYGRAGWLMGAALLNRHVHPEAVPAAVLQGVVTKVLSSGKATAAALRDRSAFPTPLFFLWPPSGHDAAPYLGAAHGLMGRWKGGMTAEVDSPLWYTWHGKPYLGAAHGLFGILYVLLHFPALLNAIPGAAADVAGALEYVCTLECDAEGRRGPHGHYPTQMGPWRDREPLVHWCHGATGAVLLFCHAHEVLGGQQYLEAALRSGEAVWERGLLRKGPGACHGISGNAYALLKLHRTTGDATWLHRALRFASFMNSEEFRSGARTPDHPHSLFEGWAAAACLWADLLVPARGGFPLFELDI